MFKAIWSWLEERTGLPSAIRHFLDEDIPASAGWHQVFGSVALFAFLIQVATGLLLALNFGSTPTDAHASVRYIMTQVTGGPLIRGLHHWGSSAMIIVVVLHLIQVSLWGAYKKPREATWMVGCVLLLLTLAFGLTGYLLPWDNKSYWATTVTAHIAALPPVAGPYVARLLGVQGGAIGVITFARFYAAHIMLLPLVTLLLIGVHLVLVRKHGVTPTPADATKPKKKFYPEQVFKDTVAVFAFTMALVLMANFAKVGLGSMADPTDTSFTPRPEWYFLFLFQTLKLFQGPLEVVGAVILPTIALIALILVPFIDRAAAMRVQKRTVAMALVAFCALGWAGLTQRAIATTPADTEDPEAGLKPPSLWAQIPAEQVAAVGYFRKDNCGRCHVLGRSSMGPDLAREASNKPADWLLEHFAKPAPDGPDSQLTGAQMKALVALVTKRDEKGVDAWKSAPEEIVAGAMTFQTRQCFLCHQLNGVGGSVGPVMNGLSTRHTRDWIMGHFGDPSKYVKGSRMPAYKLPPEELAQVTDYLLAIPK
jgi:quinol-cytochrome oxidoreductase complex cytochrome b subunit